MNLISILIFINHIPFHHLLSCLKVNHLLALNLFPNRTLPAIANSSPPDRKLLGIFCQNSALSSSPPLNIHFLAASPDHSASKYCVIGSIQPSTHSKIGDRLAQLVSPGFIVFFRGKCGGGASLSLFRFSHHQDQLEWSRLNL